MTRQEIAETLELFSKVAESLGALSPQLMPAMEVAGALLLIGADLEGKGLDSIQHITRAISLDDPMNQAQDDVNKEADKKFGDKN